MYKHTVYGTRDRLLRQLATDRLKGARLRQEINPPTPFTSRRKELTILERTDTGFSNRLVSKETFTTSSHISQQLRGGRGVTDSYFMRPVSSIKSWGRTCMDDDDKRALGQHASASVTRRTSQSMPVYIYGDIFTLHPKLWLIQIHYLWLNQ